MGSSVMSDMSVRGAGTGVALRRGWRGPPSCLPCEVLFDCPLQRYVCMCGGDSGQGLDPFVQ